MIENKTYKILIKTNDNYRKDFGISDADYKQYVYVNFVTRDIKCHLHDGSYADPTIYNKNTNISNQNIKRRYDEFMAIMMIICLADDYQPYFDEGDEYRQSHPDENIVMAQWVQDLPRYANDMPEEELNIPSINVDISNASINENPDEYYVLPFSMNEDAYKKLYDACNNVLMNYPNWIEENKGYGYEHMPTEYKNSWFYMNNNTTNNVSKSSKTINDSHENKADDDSNVKAILTIGFMSDKLVFNIRFIMVGGKQLTQPSDVDMVMPFVKPENSNNSDSNMSNTIDSTLNDDNAIMQVCEQITSKLDGFITMLMSTVD